MTCAKLIQGAVGIPTLGDARDYHPILGFEDDASALRHARWRHWLSIEQAREEIQRRKSRQKAGAFLRAKIAQGKPEGGKGLGGVTDGGRVDFQPSVGADIAAE